MATVPIEHAVRQASGITTSGAEIDSAMMQVITRAGSWTVNDDSAHGFQVGYKLVDSTTNIVYVCLDNSTGAAIWRKETPDFIRGLVWSNNATDATNDIDISAGELQCDNGYYFLASSITKRMDASWAVGSGSGGLATGATAWSSTGQVYYIFAIVVGGIKDIGIDSSSTGANLVSSHSATIIKRIGTIPSVQTASTMPLVTTTEIAGGVLRIELHDRIHILSTSTPATAETNISTGLPNVTLGISAFLAYGTNTVFLWIKPTHMLDVTPAVGDNHLVVYAGSAYSSSSFQLNADSSGNIKYRSSAGTVSALQIGIDYYIDSRGDL